MHAGIGHHPFFKRPSVPDESGVAIMSRSAGTDTIITTHTAIQVYQHRLSSIDKTLFNRPLH